MYNVPSIFYYQSSKIHQIVNPQLAEQRGSFFDWLTKSQAPSDDQLRHWTWSNAQEMEHLWSEEVNFIEAAGGIVRDEKHRILLIYRNKKWDLPKGKLEELEDAESAAIREIKEETGVTVDLLMPKVCTSTFHLYEDIFTDKKFTLKKTYWYSMIADATSCLLIPQQEEGIEVVEWTNYDAWQERRKHTYLLVRELADSFFMNIQK